MACVWLAYEKRIFYALAYADKFSKKNLVSAYITTYTDVCQRIQNVDAFGYNGSIKELLSFHDKMKFTTFDRDNDAHSTINCVSKYMDGGGWWAKDCYRLGVVNGVYGKHEPGGIGYWDTANIPIKDVNIRIRPMEGTCA